MITRLKIKFVCINMLIVTVMLGVIFGLVIHNTNRNMEEQGYRTIQSIHEDFSHRGPAPRWNRAPYFIAAIAPDGELYISENTFSGGEDTMDVQSIALSVYSSGKKEGILQEHGLRFSRRPSPKGEELVFLDVSLERHILKDLILTCMKIGAVSYALFLGLSILLAQWAIHPVKTAWKNQRQFVADASHELKTPLTVIMTNGELLQEDVYPPEERQQFVRNILDMSRQMRGLVEGLLDLARVDNGVVRTTFAELDFSSLVENCLLPFEPLFFEKGMDLLSDVEPGILLRGSSQYLRQVVEILLDNAVKYGEENRPVKVSMHRQNHHSLLSVSTEGKEISRDDLKQIFKRFYRIDKTRAMNHSYGLGLAIAQTIAHDHRGKIWAESRQGINTFFVQLPLGHARQLPKSK